MNKKNVFFIIIFLVLFVVAITAALWFFIGKNYIPGNTISAEIMYGPNPGQTVSVQLTKRPWSGECTYSIVSPSGDKVIRNDFPFTIRGDHDKNDHFQMGTSSTFNIGPTDSPYSIMKLECGYTDGGRITVNPESHMLNKVDKRL